MNDKSNNTNEILNAEQVSQYLCIPIRTIYHLTKQGKIKAAKIGKQWRYMKQDIDHYLQHGTNFSQEPIRIPYPTSSEFIERRKWSRLNTNLKCQYQINLQPFKTINDHGIVKNISANGLFLCMPNDKLNKVDISDPVKLQFSLVANGGKINISAIVLRKNDHGFGLKFRHINEDTQKDILDYIG